PEDIMSQWMSGRGNSLVQSCPDFAIHRPFKIVFEGKYFEKTGPDKAVRASLVRSIYEAFFYRGLPFVPPKKGGPAWDYEYSCLLIGDASDQGGVRAAWEAIPQAVRQGFWNGANIFVMVVRGSRS